MALLTVMQSSDESRLQLLAARLLSQLVRHGTCTHPHILAFSDNILQTIYCKLYTRNYLLRTIYYELFTTNYLLRTIYYELFTSNYLLRTIYLELFTTNYLLRTIYYELFTTNYLLRTIYYQLFTSNYLLRTIYYKLFTTNYLLFSLSVSSAGNIMVVLGVNGVLLMQKLLCEWISGDYLIDGGRKISALQVFIQNEL